MQRGPIVMIEDDSDDTELFQDILKELQIPIPFVAFETTFEAKDFLLTNPVKPFMIICDINLPGQNGLAFKREIDQNILLRKKCIPFIFYSTSINQQTVNNAYDEFAVQGYFQKADSMARIRNTWEIILKYWMTCRHPDMGAVTYHH